MCKCDFIDMIPQCELLCTPKGPCYCPDLSGWILLIQLLGKCFPWTLIPPVKHKQFHPVCANTWPARAAKLPTLLPNSGSSWLGPEILTSPVCQPGLWCTAWSITKPLLHQRTAPKALGNSAMSGKGQHLGADVFRSHTVKCHQRKAAFGRGLSPVLEGIQKFLRKGRGMGGAGGSRQITSSMKPTGRKQLLWKADTKAFPRFVGLIHVQLNHIFIDTHRNAK